MHLKTIGEVVNNFSSSIFPFHIYHVSKKKDPVKKNDLIFIEARYGGIIKTVTIQRFNDIIRHE